MAVNNMVNKLASKALEKAFNESAKVSSPPKGQSFKDVLSNIDTGHDFAEALGAVDQKLATNGQMKAIPVEGMEISNPELVKPSGPNSSETVVNMLSEVNKGSMQMENLVNNILYSGKRFNNQELLVMQAHIFHHAQTMELAVKLAGEGVSSVKSVLNTQVQ